MGEPARGANGQYISPQVVQLVADVAAGKTATEALKELLNAKIKAVEDTAGAAVATGKEARLTAEKAQETWNVAHNGFQRKLDDQAKEMLSRTEADLRFNSIERLQWIIIGLGALFVIALLAHMTGLVRP